MRRLVDSLPSRLVVRAAILKRGVGKSDAIFAIVNSVDFVEHRIAERRVMSYNPTVRRHHAKRRVGGRDRREAPAAYTVDSGYSYVSKTAPSRLKLPIGRSNAH